MLKFVLYIVFKNIKLCDNFMSTDIPTIMDKIIVGGFMYGKRDC